MLLTGDCSVLLPFPPKMENIYSNYFILILDAETHRGKNLCVLIGLLIKNNGIQEIVPQNYTQEASSVSESGLNDKILKLKPLNNDVIDATWEYLGRYACERKEIICDQTVNCDCLKILQ